MGFFTLVSTISLAALFLGGAAKAEMCAGCPIEVNPNDIGAEKLVTGALTTMNTNSPHSLYLVKILRTTSQIVNGVKYKVQVKVGESGTNNVKDCEMVFVSQPWINKEPQFVSENCSPNRVTRQLLGGLKDVDPSEMEMVNELADHAVTTLDEIDADDTKQVVVEIIDAKKQLVNGIMYHLEMRVKTTGCKESEPACLNTEPIEMKHCKMQIHRSFADQSPLNAKVVKSVCEPIPILGGIHPVDVNDDSLSNIADLAVHRISDMTNSIYVSGLVEIIKASSQVVEGMKYYLTVEVGDTKCLKSHFKNGDTCKVTPTNSRYKNICNAVVWDKPWEKFTKVLSADCQSILTPHEVIMKKERSMSGSGVNVDPKDSYVQDLSKFALSEMDKQTNSDYRLGSNNIVHATSQIVAGVKMTMTMEVGETTCKKGEETNADCKPSGPTKECTVVVWDRPWLNDRRILSTHCHNNKILRKAREISGGISDIDINSKQVTQLLPFTSTELTNKMNSAHTQGIVRVLKASSQIVAGTLTRMKVEVADTDCLKSENRDPSECKIQSNGVSQICDVEIWSRPWLNKTEMRSASCYPNHEPSVERIKRSLIGGHKEEDPNSSKIQELAKFAVSEWDKTTNSEIAHGLHHVVNATSQIISGRLYTLNLAVGKNICPKTEDASSCAVNSVTHLCKMVIVEPVSGAKQVKKHDCVISEHKRKRRAILGGVKDIDPNDPLVTRMSEYFLNRLNEQSNSEYKLGLSRVISSKYQVVSGSKVILKLAVGPITCNEDTDDVCADPSPTKVCDVVLWDRPWLKKIEILEFHCEDYKERKKRTLVGSDKPLDLDEEQRDELMSFISEDLTRRTNSDKTKKVIKVLGAHYQVVSGILRKLTVEVGETKCLKSENRDFSQCELSSVDEKDHETCLVVIWEQAWRKHREVKSVECHFNTESVADNAKMENVDYMSLAQILEVDTENKAFQRFYFFKKNYNKKYKSTQELKKRFRIFRGNLKKIDYLQKTEQGTGLYGPTMFADLSQKEFKSSYLGFKPELAKKHNFKQRPMAVIPNITLPMEFDWRENNVVTPVKNQGLCGSCWAFSVTGNIEGQYAIKYNTLLALSEQELVDCDRYDDGCEGGLFDTAYHAIEELGGLETESDYPYMAHDEKCFFNKSEVKVTISGGLNISTDETDMAKWLVANGPISVALNANAMQFYMGGVSHPLKFLCSPKNLDHGVLIVGYGVHNYPIFHKTLPYWLVKNSWGVNWGVQGYYMIYRGDGTCGINEMPSSAVL